MEFLATTVPGLDKVAMAEIREISNATVTYEHKGMIRIEAPVKDALALHYSSKMLHKLFVKLDEGEFEELADLYEATYALPLEDFLGARQPFAFRVNRSGKHHFQSPDAERLCGEAVIERMRAKTGQRIPVHLDAPQVIIRTFIRGRHYWTGLEATGDSLHRRFYRLHHHPAALNPIIAHGMLRLSGWQSGESLIDPMCGSGTIPIEAAHWRYGIRNYPRQLLFHNFAFLDDATRRALHKFAARPPIPASDTQIAGADISPRHIDFAQKLAREAHTDIPLRVADATGANLNYDRIVSNPPYGIRIGTRQKVERLYRAFLDNLFAHQWKSTVLLTARPDLIPRDVVEWAYHIDYGNLKASILLIKP